AISHQMHTSGSRISVKENNSGVPRIHLLRLYRRGKTTIFSREQKGWRRQGQTSRVCNYPLEPDPFRRQRKRRAKGARCAGRALSNLLAAHFLVCASTQPFN